MLLLSTKSLLLPPSTATGFPGCHISPTVVWNTSTSTPIISDKSMCFPATSLVFFSKHVAAHWIPLLEMWPSEHRLIHMRDNT